VNGNTRYRRAGYAFVGRAFHPLDSFKRFHYLIADPPLPSFSQRDRSLSEYSLANHTNILILTGRACKFCHMAKTYRLYLPDQDFLLPPSPQDWLPEHHLAYFVSDVVDQLDLSAIESVYCNGSHCFPAKVSAHFPASFSDSLPGDWSAVLREHASGIGYSPV
jgi:hypothetical protein